MTALQLVPPGEAVSAPEWTVSGWFNTETDSTLADFRGRVVALHAFQMLCPGCVSHGLPQAQRIHLTFAPADVATIGLHSVFEHHAAMRPLALEAFLHEYRIAFPVAVDAADHGGRVPLTMQRYEMRGTPTLILIDRGGRLRLNAFGRPDDLAVGAAIATLIAEDEPLAVAEAASERFTLETAPATCSPDGCAR